MLKNELTDKALLPTTEGVPLSLPGTIDAHNASVGSLLNHIDELRAYCQQQGLIKADLLGKLAAGDDDLTEAFQEAADEHSSDGELEFDAGAIVSLSEKLGEGVTGLRGAYVQCWRFVEVSELPPKFFAQQRAIYTCTACGNKFPSSECGCGEGCKNHEDATRIEEIVACDGCGKKFRYGDLVSPDDIGCARHEGAEAVDGT